MQTDRIIHGDSLNELKALDSESVDLVCTDPPYGYSFMGKSWDKTLPDIGIFKECLRVLKPGAFAFVMSAPRSDVCARMMLLLEDAGFEIGFTPIYWTYASGFPKAMNIGKMVDKRNGEDRTPPGRHLKVEGEMPIAGNAGRCITCNKWRGSQAGNCQCPKTTPAISDEAKALDGSYGGFQPKPAVEVIIVAMKPLSEKTYVDQALRNGKGITWLDDCRVPTESDTRQNARGGDNGLDGTQTFKIRERRAEDQIDHGGRFPANLIISDDVLNDHSRFFSVDEWAKTIPFLIVPKAAKSEKNKGCENRNPQLRAGVDKMMGDPQMKTGSGNERSRLHLNNHPTVKPLKLMSYLITLGSRPGDTVLDPFLGSGTTAIAAKQLRRKYIGIEREQEYVTIAEARIGAIVPTLL